MRAAKIGPDLRLNLGKHLFFDWLCVSSMKKGFKRIVRLVPVFILDTHNQTNYNCLPKFVQTDNASLLFKNGQLIIRFKKWKKEMKKFKN